MDCVATVQLRGCSVKGVTIPQWMGMTVFQQCFIYGHGNMNSISFSWVTKYYSSIHFFSQPFKDRKAILSAQAIQKSAETSSSCLPTPDLNRWDWIELLCRPSVYLQCTWLIHLALKISLILGHFLNWLINNSCKLVDMSRDECWALVSVIQPIGGQLPISINPLASRGGLRGAEWNVLCLEACT